MNFSEIYHPIKALSNKIRNKTFRSLCLNITQDTVIPILKFAIDYQPEKVLNIIQIMSNQAFLVSDLLSLCQSINNPRFDLQICKIGLSFAMNHVHGMDILSILKLLVDIWTRSDKKDQIEPCFRQIIYHIFDSFQKYIVIRKQLAEKVRRCVLDQLIINVVSKKPIENKMGKNYIHLKQYYQDAHLAVAFLCQNPNKMTLSVLDYILSNYHIPSVTDHIENLKGSSLLIANIWEKILIKYSDRLGKRVVDIVDIIKRKCPEKVDKLVNPKLLWDYYVNFDCQHYQPNLILTLFPKYSRDILHWVREFPLIDQELYHGKESKEKFQIGIGLFREKPKVGIKYFLEQGFITDKISKFLFEESLNPEAVGKYLGEHQHDLIEYIGYFDFKGLSVDQALRKLFSKFKPEGENQKIDQCLTAFAQRYLAQNSCNLKEDQVWLYSMALIMLNTDLNIAKKSTITPEKWLDILKSLSIEADLDVYQRIKAEPIKYVYDPKFVYENRDYRFGNIFASYWSEFVEYSDNLLPLFELACHYDIKECKTRIVEKMDLHRIEEKSCKLHDCIFESFVTEFIVICDSNIEKCQTLVEMILLNKHRDSQLFVRLQPALITLFKKFFTTRDAPLAIDLWKQLVLNGMSNIDVFCLVFNQKDEHNSLLALYSLHVINQKFPLSLQLLQQLPVHSKKLATLSFQIVIQNLSHLEIPEVQLLLIKYMSTCMCVEAIDLFRKISKERVTSIVLYQLLPLLCHGNATIAGRVMGLLAEIVDKKTMAKYLIDLFNRLALKNLDSSEKLWLEASGFKAFNLLSDSLEEPTDVIIFVNLWIKHENEIMAMNALYLLDGLANKFKQWDYVGLALIDQDIKLDLFRKPYLDLVIQVLQWNGCISPEIVARLLEIVQLNKKEIGIDRSFSLFITIYENHSMLGKDYLIKLVEDLENMEKCIVLTQINGCDLPIDVLKALYPSFIKLLVHECSGETRKQLYIFLSKF